MCSCVFRFFSFFSFYNFCPRETITTKQRASLRIGTCVDVRFVRSENIKGWNSLSTPAVLCLPVNCMSLVSEEIKITCNVIIPTEMKTELQNWLFSCLRGMFFVKPMLVNPLTPPVRKWISPSLSPQSSSVIWQRTSKTCVWQGWSQSVRRSWQQDGNRSVSETSPGMCVCVCYEK